MSTTYSTTPQYTIGDDESIADALGKAQQSQATLDMIDQTVGSRTSQWEQAIQAELQDLITQASDLRRTITTAKTTTKRKFYQKKFDKVNVQVRQMLIALQRVRMQQTMATNMNGPVDANSTSAV